MSNLFIDQCVVKIKEAFQGSPRYRVALDAGLSSEALKKINADDWNPTRRTLEALERLIPEDFDFAMSDPKNAKGSHDDVP